MHEQPDLVGFWTRHHAAENIFPNDIPEIHNQAIEDIKSFSYIHNFITIFFFFKPVFCNIKKLKSLFLN